MSSNSLDQSILVNQPVLIGLDFGLQRIGVAIAEQGLASPLLVIENDEQVWQQLSKLCIKYQPEKIILGLSQGMAAEIRKFALELERKMALNVILVDEELSSYEARQKQHQAGRFRQPDDAAAAAVILQDYLDFGDEQI